MLYKVAIYIHKLKLIAGVAELTQSCEVTRQISH